MTARDVAAFTGLVDLASEEIGGRALSASDDFFAGRDNLLRPGRAVFDPDAYTERGKEMDGWESRRRRVPGHDWCVIRLGVRGRIRGVDVDTDHFLGNHPPFASLDAAGDDLAWREVLPPVALRPGARNLFAVAEAEPFTHVRLHIYPDGGVARLRVYGDPEPAEVEAGLVDLAGVRSGGRAVLASDQFFSPANNLLLPERSTYMGGGWESRRRRGPGEDWAIVALGAAGTLDHLVVDTGHFHGNFPDRCRVDGLYWPGAPAHALAGAEWTPVLSESALRADSVHTFDDLASAGPFTHLRLSMIPCGGIARFRAFGTPAAPPADPLLDRVNALDVQGFLRCCGSRRWAEGMAAARPFASRAHLFGEAERLWWWLTDEDWLEAFRHHPRIGDRQLRDRWAAGEQAGVSGAAEETLAALAQGNAAYEERFGFLFLVNATGKTAEQMLALLRQRLANPPENELRVAAAEQVKITRIRLEKA